MARPYGVMFDDGRYMIFELTEEDYEALAKAILDGKFSVKLSIGVIVLTNIRFVIEQREQVEENKPANPPMTLDEQAWIHKMIRGEIENAG